MVKKKFTEKKVKNLIQTAILAIGVEIKSSVKNGRMNISKEDLDAWFDRNLYGGSRKPKKE